VAFASSINSRNLEICERVNFDLGLGIPRGHLRLQFPLLFLVKFLMFQRKNEFCLARAQKYNYLPLKRSAVT